MRIADFLALPGTPCIRLRVGGGLDDVVEIDQLHFETHRDELLEYCLSLPNVEAKTWREMKEFTGGNGTLARALIALGDLVGAWQMHPLHRAPGPLWTRNTPRILMVHSTPKPLVPKPSAGDLEGEICFCCEREMGPPNSKFHGLHQASKGSKLCLECEVMGCELEQGPCNVFPEKKAEQRSRPKDPEEEEYLSMKPPPGLEDYLKQFS